MLVYLVLNLITLVLNGIFGWLPVVEHLPTINGYDIDGALVSGVGMFNRLAENIWPLLDMFYAFLVLLGYYVVKMGLKFILGHRAPGHSGH